MRKSDFHAKILKLWRSGCRRPGVIASAVGVGRSTVYRVLEKARQHGAIKGQAPIGRPRATTPEQDLHLLEIVSENWNRPMASIRRAWGASVSKRTLLRRLQTDSRWRRGVAMRRTPLQERHLAARVAWASQHLSWSVAQWNQVVWADEKKWLLTNRGRIWIFRLAGHHDDPRFQIREKTIAGKICTWACFGHGRPIAFCFFDEPLTNDKYQVILQNRMLPAAKRVMGRWWYFQDDNTGEHRGDSLIAYKKAAGIRSLEWPPSSPDLALIENVWRIWHQHVQDRCPTTIGELKRYIREEWERIPAGALQNIIASMPRRCKLIVENGGWRIRS